MHYVLEEVYWHNVTSKDSASSSSALVDMIHKYHVSQEYWCCPPTWRNKGRTRWEILSGSSIPPKGRCCPSFKVDHMTGVNTQQSGDLSSNTKNLILCKSRMTQRSHRFCAKIGSHKRQIQIPTLVFIEKSSYIKCSPKFWKTGNNFLYINKDSQPGNK